MLQKYKIWLPISIGILIGTIAIFSASFLIVKSYSSRYIHNNLADLPNVKVIIIPGAAILQSGKVSPVLRDRIDTAIAIYNKGISKKILVTGDSSSLSYNEVVPMRNYLIQNGIPEKDIFMDFAGLDTYSSMYRAKAVFLVDSMIIVSQSFHLPRAVFIARNLGINAYGMESDKGHYLLRNDIREIFGDVKAIGNLIFKRQPKYLGQEMPL